MVEAVKRSSNLPLDVHLMIIEPEKWTSQYLKAGASNISFHFEACADSVALALEIRKSGATVGLAIKPCTSFEQISDILPNFDLLLIMTVEPGFGGQSFIPEMLTKITQAREFISKNQLNIKIQADGGVNLSTIKAAADAGADVFVTGSVVYSAKDPGEMINTLRELIAN